MATHKPFRELINPNSNFEFVETRRVWGLVSFVLIVASIGALFVNKAVRGDYLNWTIDFKGGTEIHLLFNEKGSGKPAVVSTGEVRSALEAAGKEGLDVSDFGIQENDVELSGVLLRTAEFGALTRAQQEKLSDGLVEKFADRKIAKASWSGDRLFVRSKASILWQEMQDFFAGHQLDLRPWSSEDTEAARIADEGTGEYNLYFSIRGVDAQYENILTKAFGDRVDVSIKNVYGVGAKAGAQLRNDGIKALFYAMALIMLYLAIRFDIRFAPGAVVALLHDVILVIGMLAVTWQEVSLTTVAALLTVIGYSVNDTVVIFDRVRENVELLKDKRFARVINVSLNETMSRTLLTSITLFVVTLMMNVFGTGLVANFAFAMNVGVVVGVYSSVFIACPVALAIHNKWYAGRGASK